MFTIDLTTLAVPDVGEWSGQLSIAIASAMPAAAEVLREAADSCFEAQADPWGNAWAPHADSTLLAVGRAAAGPSRRRVRFIGPLAEGARGPTRSVRWSRRRSERASAAIFGKKILIDTGMLRGSLHGEVLAGSSGEGIARVTAGGPAAAYAGVHQWGSKDGSIPARPFLALRGSPENPTVELPTVVHDEVVATIQGAIDAFVARMNAERSAAR